MHNETKPITSHSCGNGKYARMVWGSVEDCRPCTERKRLMEAARQAYAKKDVITFENGDKAVVNQDGIIEDICSVNQPIAKDGRPSAVESAFADFAAKSAAMFLLLFIGAMFTLSLPPDERLSVRVGNDAGMEAK